MVLNVLLPATTRIELNDERFRQTSQHHSGTFIPSVFVSAVYLRNQSSNISWHFLQNIFRKVQTRTRALCLLTSSQLGYFLRRTFLLLDRSHSPCRPISELRSFYVNRLLYLIFQPDKQRMVFAKRLTVELQRIVQSIHPDFSRHRGEHGRDCSAQMQGSVPTDSDTPQANQNHTELSREYLVPLHTQISLVSDLRVCG